MAHKNAMKKFVLAIKIFPQHYGTAREVEHQEQQLTQKKYHSSNLQLFL